MQTLAGRDLLEATLLQEQRSQAAGMGRGALEERAGQAALQHRMNLCSCSAVIA